MGYDEFKRKVNALVGRATGNKVNVRFSTDKEKGKHYANCSDGTTIIANASCKRVMVRWGSGHQAIATI